MGLEAWKRLSSGYKGVWSDVLMWKVHLLSFTNLLYIKSVSDMGTIKGQKLLKNSDLTFSRWFYYFWHVSACRIPRAWSTPLTECPFKWLVYWRCAAVVCMSWISSIFYSTSDCKTLFLDRNSLNNFGIKLVFVW